MSKRKATDSVPERRQKQYPPGFSTIRKDLGSCFEAVFRSDLGQEQDETSKSLVR